MKKKILGVLAAVMLGVGLWAAAPAPVYAEDEVVSDGNDTYETATYLNMNGSALDVISSRYDVDYFRIRPNNNGLLSVSFEHTYADSSDMWDVKLCKFENGELRALSSYRIHLYDKEVYSLPSVGVVAGTDYYVVITPCSGDKIYSAMYTVRTTFQASEYCEREMNGSYATATVMNTNQSYQGTLNDTDDLDFYKITVPANGKLQFSFEHTYADSKAGWEIKLYKYEDGEYKGLSETLIHLYDKENIELPMIGATAGADYYVVISKYSYYENIGAIYTVKNTFQSSEYYERETNGSYAAATDFSLNQTYYGTLNTSDDADFWKFTAPDSGTVNLYFGHTYADSDSGWYVYVYQYKNGEYKELSNIKILLNQNNSILASSFTAEKNGVYYAKIVGANSAATGDEYSLKVKYTVNQPSYFHLSTAKKKASLSWQAATGAAGYEIYYKTGKGSYKKLATTKKTSYTYKKLSKKTYTYFKVRAYRMDGTKKVYSKFSYVLKAKAS